MFLNELKWELLLVFNCFHTDLVTGSVQYLTGKQYFQDTSLKI